jgi:hypothetical protein
LVTTRTIAAGGSEAGTFTTGTRPTDTEVTDLIGTAVLDVTLAVGGADIPDQYADSATQAAALRTAQLVELSYYPESASTTGTAATLAAAYLTAIAALQDELHWTEIRLP